MSLDMDFKRRIRHEYWKLRYWITVALGTFIAAAMIHSHHHDNASLIVMILNAFYLGAYAIDGLESAFVAAYRELAHEAMHNAQEAVALLEAAAKEKP